MNNLLKYLFVTLVFAGSMACHQDDINTDDENELITTVQLKFTEQGNATPTTYAWRDLDGDGGNMPVIQPIQLKANRNYQVEVVFLNESVTPVEDKTVEIKAEADEHLVIYTPTPTSLFTYTASDKDNRNLPLGVVGQLRTGAASAGTLRVQLRHQPPVNGMATKNGDVTPGSDDVNVTFNMTIVP